MKRISQYKKLFNVEKDLNLKELKSTYRSLVKQWHPDKFQKDDALFAEAQLKSTEIIDAYHFLVSIAPETKEANAAEYEATVSTNMITDMKHKSMLLELTFQDGSTYEYFGVTKKVYEKLYNSDKPTRFAKRNIFNSYIYRKAKKATA